MSAFWYIFFTFRSISWKFKIFSLYIVINFVLNYLGILISFLHLRATLNLQTAGGGWTSTSNATMQIAIQPSKIETTQVASHVVRPASIPHGVRPVGLPQPQHVVQPVHVSAAAAAAFHQSKILVATSAIPTSLQLSSTASSTIVSVGMIRNPGGKP